MTGRAEPNGPLRVWTLILASIGSFVAALDVVVVATALPALREDLGASLFDLEWTINAYNLAFACLMLTGAAIGDRIGRRRTYAAGLLVFAAASIGAALSQSGTELIVARVIQGAGAAAVLPLTLALISDAFPYEKRGAAIGLWGGVTGLGVSSGPVFGGAIIEGISWQWIFWINVPIGATVAVLSQWKLRESYGPRPQLDLPGLGLVGLAMFGLTWAPVRAPRIGWGSAEVIGSLLLGVALVVAFLAWERRATYPMVPLAYFRSREFTTANGVIFFQFMSLIGAVFLLTQLFQVGMGYGPFDAGLRTLAFFATPVVAAPIAGLLADRFGNKPFMVIGLSMQGLGLLWLTALVEPGVGYPTLVAPLVFAGVGTAMCFPTVANAVTSAVPVADTGVAAGTNNALREVGGVFGVAVLAAVFADNGGGYASAANFIDGFQPAMYIGAAMAGVGVVWAALAPSSSAAEAGRQALARRDAGLVGSRR
ncbi:MFS transporter [Solicola gregarius]|uniref:MFS transporter n=1 Tax=Solicola gregarius TaxID=2908642 RepID=A0AA46TG52_9ACTN|nr:MFS transporter [Solicola gregarius]UYM04630.1 MFS transporter [Solicola gregarius]